MNNRKTLSACLPAALLLVATLLMAQNLTNRPAKPLTTDALGGPDRFITALSTDKPIYLANEPVYVRGVVLRADTRKPLPGTERGYAVVKVTGPKGEQVASGRAELADSVIGFAWRVPEGQAGGEYTVNVTWPHTGWAPAERKFDVRAFRAPRLRSQIVFQREGYGPGDTVSVSLHTERAEGGFPVNAKVTAIARIDENEAWRGSTTIDTGGNCSVRFDLPKAIERGQGTMAFVVEDGGTVETASKTIPILLQTVDLSFYPEGGDLIAGLPQRVYFEARRPDGKPADLAGQVLAHTPGKEPTPVAEFRSEHEGRGRFELTPTSGATYTVRLTAPAGIERSFDMPAVKASGAVLRSASDVYEPGQPLKFTVIASPGVKDWTLMLGKREVVVASAAHQFAGKAGEASVYHVELDPRDSQAAEGVLVATLWDSLGKPLAERLVFRRPAKSIQVKIEPDQSSYTPGGQVKLNVITTDEHGKPAAGVVGLSVVDDSVLELIDKREQPPRLPVMVLLEPEVRDLADAHVYLDASHEKSALATDLLLGTQGWRRFAFISESQFRAEHGDAARRVLALREPVQIEARRFAMFAMQAPVPAAAAVPEGAVDGAVDKRLGAVEKNAPAPPAEPALAQPVVEELKKEREERQDVAELPAATPAPVARPKASEADALFADEAIAGAEARNDMVAVRQFAHEVRPNRQATDRVDFAQTLYWCASVKTDDRGLAQVAFGLSDAVTSFRVHADAFDARGALGHGSTAVSSVQPFYLEPKLPLQVTTGDVIDLPVTVVNNTAGDLVGVTLTTTVTGDVSIAKVKPFDVPAGQRVRRVVRLTVGQVAGDVTAVVEARAGEFVDKVTRPLNIAPTGFPTQLAFGGVLTVNGAATHEFVIPDTLTPDSVSTSVAVYPTPLANLTQALAALVREPYGCFEQTSSTSYPMCMAQQYFVSHAGVDPALIARAGDMLDKSYQRLVGFECKEKGYEWFGGAAPGHEALTAYGLMQFKDMKRAKLPVVEDQMVQRTRAWLLSRRDGKGGFMRNERALDSFGGAPADTTNAYITWAMLEAGETGLDKEVAAVKQAALASGDSYVVALAANIAAMTGDNDTARTLMQRLVAKQNDKTGAIDGASTSITRSGGDALAIETTALTVLAWLRDRSFAGRVEPAMKFLCESCKDGRFASTQSTILALKAITEYDKSRATPRAPGSVEVLVNGKRIGQPVKFDTATKDALKLTVPADELAPGRHTLTLRMIDGSEMPYSVAIGFHSTVPASAEACKVTVQTRLAQRSVDEGAATEAVVVVSNPSKSDAATPVAIIGIPGGLEVRHDQLKELVKAGRVDAYEVIGRDVVLYWRQIKADTRVELALSLIAAVPGTYTGPASRAYEYYTDELRQWTEGATVTINPAGR